MNYVYLVCSRNLIIEKVGCDVKPFKKSEINAEIARLAESELPSLLNVFQCYSSWDKAFSCCEQLNSDDSYRYYQRIYRYPNGRIVNVRLTVYDYYVVKRAIY